MINGVRGIGNGGCLGHRADETDRWAKAWFQSSGIEMHLLSSSQKVKVVSRTLVSFIHQ